jgi:NAD+ synthase
MVVGWASFSFLEVFILDWVKFERGVIEWMRKKVKESGATGLVSGLSGGIDSACVAVLSHRAFGSSYLALFLGCESSEKDREDAREVARKFGMELKEIDLTPLYQSFINMLPPGNALAKANLKPRLRMITLYYFANMLNRLVAGTGNKSELKVGYFTKYGDGGVDILPLGDLYKTQVRELAYYLGIPERIIKKPPSAGLWAGQTDEEEMGITYEELDAILEGMEKGVVEELEPSKVEKVKSMMEKSQHKLEIPPVFKF